MKKILLKDFIFQGRVKDHELVRDKLLSEISKSEFETTIKSEDRFESIQRFDWCNAKDMSRKWIRIFTPHFNSIVNEFLSITPYLSIELIEMWFQ